MGQFAIIIYPRLRNEQMWHLVINHVKLALLPETQIMHIAGEKCLLPYILRNIFKKYPEPKSRTESFDFPSNSLALVF